jgi:hypothetical protein
MGSGRRMLAGQFADATLENFRGRQRQVRLLAQHAPPLNQRITPLRTSIRVAAFSLLLAHDA